MRSTGQRAYLGLGSNLGDRLANLQAAVARLVALPGVRVTRTSAVYETEPVGYADQPWFLNAVVEIETSLEPAELLEAVKGIETELGRTPGPRWGPRPIDIDILLYGDRTVQTPTLQLPHPELWNRLFVLAPLAELAPDLQGPGGERVQQRVERLQSRRQVHRVAGNNAFNSRR